MIEDLLTVFSKEWKEILLQRSSGGGGARQPLIMAAIVGILIPLRSPADHPFSPAWFLLLTVMCSAAITAVVADAFAGERERHTLESLLATRLPDRAILLGKIAACVAYGWAITLLCVVLGVITVNVAHWHGQIVIFNDAQSWLAVTLGPPLVGAAMASAGVVVSLRAATVRQAQQTLGVGLMVVIFGAVFGYGALPDSTKTRLMQTLFEWSMAELIVLAAAIVLAIDAALILAAMARFQRSKLVLD